MSIRSTHGFGDFRPIGWSADGKYVYAFDGRKQIMMVRADGDGVKPLIELSLREGSSVGKFPTMTPDGQRVIYSSEQTRSDVWIVEHFDNR